MSVTVPTLGKFFNRFKVGDGLRYISAMLVVMWGVGLIPVFALMNVPADTGEMKQERLQGFAALEHLEARMAEKPARWIAYQKGLAKLREKGLRRSAVVVARSYPITVKKSALRKLADIVVPTLYARQYYSELIFDDWSGFNQYYDGTAYSYDGWYREAMMLISFNKDPNTGWNSISAEALWWSGWDPDEGNEHVSNKNPRSLQEKLIRVGHRMKQAVYPTLDAERISKSWWDRFEDWASCTVTGCSTAATACYLSNVWNAESLWAPCFTAWCGGAEVGCAVGAMLQ